MLDSNLFTHHNTYTILREATSETYGPRVYSRILIFHQQAISGTVYFAIFIFQSIQQKYQKIFILLSLSDLTFASGREGIDNPFIALGASCLIFCAGIGDLCVVSYWIDTLVLKK